MAAQETSERFYCEPCKKSWVYRSKFERHLSTASHKLAERMFDFQVPTVTTFTSPSIQEEQLEQLEHASDSTNVVMSDQSINAHGIDEPKDFPYGSSEDESDDGRDDNGYLSMDLAEEDEDIQIDFLAMLESVKDITDFTPFPSKLFALLYMLVHSPHRIGESTLKFIWSILHQTQEVVPSFTDVKKFVLLDFQPPQKHYTDQGIPFHIRRPSHILKQCLGMPSIAKLLHRLPVSGSSCYDELYHGKRWNEDPRFQAPMIEVAGSSFYVNDFIVFQHDQYGRTNGKILKFFNKEDQSQPFSLVQCLPTLSQFVRFNTHVNYMYCDPSASILADKVVVPMSSAVQLGTPPILIVECLPDGTLCTMDDENYHSFTSLNRMDRSDLPVVICPLIVYSDDTSGNRSKKWNKFDYWCILLAGLPRHENSKLSNIHFIGCSNRANCMEISAPIAGDLLLLEQRGIVTYDALLEKQVRLIAPVIIFIGDNPRASEVLNHMGSSAKKFCRMCLADKDTSPDTVGELRTKEGSLKAMESIRKLSTETAKVDERKKCGLRESTNYLMSLPCDLYRSTPVETLHCILLGPCKYFLSLMMSSLSPKQKSELNARLHAFPMSGIDQKVLGNFTRNYGSFVGRDYKAWMQIAIFIVADYLNEKQFHAWLCLSKVFQIAYVKPFCVEDQYYHHLVCQEFVEAVKLGYPELVTKQKIHLLLHMIDNMEEFGPTSAYNTERCECFNSHLRMFNVFGNRQSPSRDIAHCFAVLEHIRFLGDGGSFDGITKSGRGFQELYRTTPVQHFLNSLPMKVLQDKNIYQHGTLRLQKSRRCQVLSDVGIAARGMPMCTIAQLCSSSQLVLPAHIDLTTSVIIFDGVVTTTGQIAHSESFVKVREKDEIMYGLLLIGVKMEDRCMCLVQEMESMAGVVNNTDCPLYSMTKTFRLIPAISVDLEVSFVHQCDKSCKFLDSGAVLIEREDVSLNKLIFQHSYTSNHLYCLNIFCMNQ